MFVMAERAEVNQLEGIDSKVIGPEEIGRLAPAMSLAPDAVHPVMGALYHPPGGIIRHDAVVWGLARGADRGGAEIHPYSEVAGIERSNGRATGVTLADGRRIAAGQRGQRHRGLELDHLRDGRRRAADHHPHPAGVRDRAAEAAARHRDRELADARLHLPDRPSEFLIGAEIEPWTTYRQQDPQLHPGSSRHSLELFPQLERARILRSWAGLCDISPDFSPILGVTEVDGFTISSGWGTYGFKAAPIVGKTMAELVATGKTPELIEPFALERFYRDRLVSELGAAAVSH